MVDAPLHLLDQTVTVQRATHAADAGGSPVSTWSTHLPKVRARVQPMSGAEALRYGRESTRRTYRVFVAGGQDIANKDRLLWTDDAGTQHTLDVQENSDLQAHGAVVRLVCEETL